MSSDLDQWAAEWAERWPEDTLTPLGMGDLAIDLRALLPQPEPTCPNCGHEDDLHADRDCRNRDEDDALCDCDFPRRVLDDVRALLAAQADATPARPEPRVWKTGDPEPEGVGRAWDRENDAWIKRPSGKWRLEKNILAGDGDLDFHNQPKGMQWADLLNEYGPLTEVPPAGAR